MRIVALCTIGAACALVLTACSGKGSDDGGGPSDGIDPSAATGGAGQIHVPTSGGKAGANSSGSSGTGASSDGCSNLEEGSACVGESYEGETVPLDIYIMFDQSGSMSNCVDPANPDGACTKTRLDAVREATTEFLHDPRSAGIGVGISFFGKQTIGQANCRDAEYSRAVVEIGQLPDHADAIMSALDGVEPTGETPTGPAIRGACEYASAWKRASAHEVVILLLTDGKPEAPVTCQNPGAECCPTLEDAVSAAESCYSAKPYVRTYVLGVGPLLQNLQEIASAGGTEKAYLVESSDVSREVLKALNTIRGDAVIPCELRLPAPPPGQTLQYDKVNIKYADAACHSTYLYNVENVAGCSDSGGWYYDDPASPHSIHLCATSCEQVSVPGGSLFYNVGCDTLFKPR